MRTSDLAPPVLPAAPLPDTSPMVDWPARLRIALDLLPQAAYVWDDADDEAVVWDAAGLVWDAPNVGSGFTDAACDFTSMEIETGPADDFGLFPAARAVFNLVNPEGLYSSYTADGRLAYMAPGRRVHVLAELAGATWWLFSGRVARWAESADGTVTVEAFDGFASLAQPVGTYTPGAAGDTPAARIAAVAAVARYTDRLVADVGNVTLTAQETSRSPLEEIQTVALSDGGIFHGDADGTLFYRDRLWRAGRRDQTSTPTVSDNVCDVPAVVWELELATNDEGLTTNVTLTNEAALTVTADAGDLYGTPYPLTHSQADQWTTTVQGQALADYLLDQQSIPYVSLETFTLHLNDPRQDLWRLGIDLRIGDRMRLLHDFAAAGGQVGTLDVEAIVSHVFHAITPTAWDVIVGTTKTVDYHRVEYWNRTVWTWDTPDPEAVWRY